MKIINTRYSYDKQNVKYTVNRQTDPFIAAKIHTSLGDAKTVLNVGAGTGSYEPIDREVTAVEPSDLMRSQRTNDRVPAIAAYAENLPFEDNSFDASMAILTIHHWPDIKKGLQELRRVTMGAVVIMTFDPDSLSKFWLADYCPEMGEVDKARFPKLQYIVESLGGNCRIKNVPVPIDCRDGFNEAYYARPEAFLNENIRRSQSFWDFLDKDVELKAVERLRNDLESGSWHKKYGHLLKLNEYEGAIRLVISENK